VYDGCCGMLAQVEGFVEAHVGPSRRDHVCGQNSTRPMVTVRCVGFDSTRYLPRREPRRS
jgi:hypothetical protein